MRRARLIVADDHVLLLDAIKSLLGARFEVVGTFTDGLALVNGAAELRPNVILLDIGMPNLSGLSAGERLKQILPNVKLVYLTMNLDVEVAAEAFRLGASAYVVKSSAATELLQLLAEGRNMKEVAYILNVAPRTVAFHKYKMMELLHLRNHTDLLRFALNSSLLAVT